MPKFLWSGRAASGVNEAVEVEAETPAEARKILEAEGWTALRQHTTEVNDFVASQMRRENPGSHTPLTAKEQLQYHEGRRSGFWNEWIKHLGKSAILILLLAVCLGLALLHRNRGPYTNIRIAGYVALLICVVFLYPAIRWWVRRTKRLFVQLQTARNWHRWDEMIECIGKLEVSKHETNVGIGEYNITRYRAVAWAGLGRLEEALTVYNAAAENAKTPGWLAHVTRASIFGAAKQYDKSLECYRAALSEDPDKPVVCLDAAMLMVQRFNEPGKAKELVARAEKGQLAELEKVHVHYVKAMIAFRERNYAIMDRDMRNALAGFQRLAINKYYIFEPALMICKGYLAVSCAALDRKAEAQKFFAQSERYLRVIELNHVLEEYENLMVALG